MCVSGQKFSCNEIYGAIQATVVCIQTTSKLWVLKTEDTNGRLYFNIASKLNLAKYEINLVELGGFLAKPVMEINKEIMDLILWHVSNVICDENKKFNDAIQAQKLIVMNETGMSSGKWHKFNGHFKSLITE
ncbi:hypothetical protein RhiirA5_437790 [Rhizophagus irregularis]|uniref:Uncharacterized protein n=1 Tax=Rhizophagus irregularis TaxID=588596 RepID=A0A2N0NK09_9GLOM|nr:hypothetical protein RhiirA5_437790 [Rhizophagus irregularis]